MEENPYKHGFDNEFLDIALKAELIKKNVLDFI